MGRMAHHIPADQPPARPTSFDRARQTKLYFALSAAKERFDRELTTEAEAEVHLAARAVLECSS